MCGVSGGVRWGFALADGVFGDVVAKDLGVVGHVDGALRAAEEVGELLPDRRLEAERLDDGVGELLRLRRFEYEHVLARLGELDGASGWNQRAWEDAIEDFYEEYGEMGVGADARGSGLIRITPGPEHWEVRQVFDDPRGDRDWAISARVDVAASDEADEVVLEVLDVGPLQPA